METTGIGTNGLYVIIEEGESDYVVIRGQEKALLYAQNKAVEKPNSHWIVCLATHGFCLKPKAKEADKKAGA